MASPDPATAIALTVSADALYLVDPETGGRRTLDQGLTDFQSGYAAWDPSHRQLAYGSAAILILDTVSGRTRTLTRGSALSMPAWSPDGGRIAFGDGVSLWVTPVPSLDVTSVSLPEGLAPLGMTWRPGLAIAFQGLELDCGSTSGCISTDLSEVWTMRPDGSGLQQLTHVGHVESPKWHPDGLRLLFVRRLGSRDQPRSTELWQVDRDGAGLTQIAPLFDVVAADWSPDGGRLAVVRRGAQPGTLQVWVGAANGAGLHPVGPPVPGTHATLDW